MADDEVEGTPTDLARAELDDLLREVLGRVDGVLDQQTRLRLLLDAVVTLAADLSLDGVLARIVSIARDLVDAQYAALGVLDVGDGTRLRTFIHHGMDPEQVVEIGHLPLGQGLLGHIITHPEPVRLHDIAAHPASYGFPPNHPPMASFLGVPVRIRDVVFGNLYLTEKVGGADFTDEDQDIVVALAAAAGVVIENARLYDQAARREQWLKATAEITNMLVDESADDALQTVADRAREVAQADVAWVVAGADVDTLTLRVVSGAFADEASMRNLSMEHSLAAEVVVSGSAVSVLDLAADSRALDPSAAFGWAPLGPAIVVPLGSRGGVEGVLALAWTPEHVDEFRSVDPTLPASFAEQAALAIKVSRVREDQQRLVVLEERDRIGRDLHDLVIQRLFAVGLSLQSLTPTVDRPELATRLTTAVDDLDDTIKDIRRTIFALGSLDTSADVQGEVTRLVERAAATLKFRPTLQFEGPVRTLVGPEVTPHLLAVLGEALSNASRHASATAVDVRVSVGKEVVVCVSDNGSGMPEGVAESGLRNMRLRAERLGGSLTIDSEGSHGTTLRWSVPVTSGTSA